MIRWLVNSFGDGDPRQAISNAYWLFWLAVLFLVPELLAWLHIIPMYTLSRTSWHDEQAHTWLRTLLAGFLLGLIVHIRFATPLAKAEAGGFVIALMAHLAWGMM